MSAQDEYERKISAIMVSIEWVKTNCVEIKSYLELPNIRIELQQVGSVYYIGISVFVDKHIEKYYLEVDLSKDEAEQAVLYSKKP